MGSAEKCLYKVYNAFLASLYGKYIYFLQCTFLKTVVDTLFHGRKKSTKYSRVVASTRVNDSMDSSMDNSMSNSKRHVCPTEQQPKNAKTGTLM